LREVPITTGAPDRDDLVEAPEQLEVVLDRLAEADAGVEPDALLRDPLAGREREPLLEECLHLVDDVVVARVELHRARVAQHVHQAAVGSRLGHHARQLGIEPERGHVVDDVRAPPR
jgi:hypothetical protein